MLLAIQPVATLNDLTVGNSTLTVSTALYRLATPYIVSTASAMAKQPYIPYDEITMHLNPTNTNNYLPNKLVVGKLEL